VKVEGIRSKARAAFAKKICDLYGLKATGNIWAADIPLIGDLKALLDFKGKPDGNLTNTMVNGTVGWNERWVLPTPGKVLERNSSPQQSPQPVASVDVVAQPEPEPQSFQLHLPTPQEPIDLIKDLFVYSLDRFVDKGILEVATSQESLRARITDGYMFSIGPDTPTALGTTYKADKIKGGKKGQWRYIWRSLVK
jgi:hypothetical protein